MKAQHFAEYKTTAVNSSNGNSYDTNDNNYSSREQETHSEQTAKYKV